jgi:hypothetical protein
MGDHGALIKKIRPIMESCESWFRLSSFFSYFRLYFPRIKKSY